MNRSVAVGILLAFGLLAGAVGYWGATDIMRFHRGLVACASPLAIDISAFWFIGFGAISLLPTLTLFKSRRAHQIVFAVLVGWFIGAPMVSHQVTISEARGRGYDVASAQTLLRLDSFTVTAVACTPRG